MKADLTLRATADAARLPETTGQPLTEVPEVAVKARPEAADHALALERWLRDEVVPGHAEYLADPSRGIPADAVLDRIKASRRSGRP